MTRPSALRSLGSYTTLLATPVANLAFAAELSHRLHAHTRVSQQHVLLFCFLFFLELAIVSLLVVVVLLTIITDSFPASPSETQISFYAFEYGLPWNSFAS